MGRETENFTRRKWWVWYFFIFLVWCFFRVSTSVLLWSQRRFGLPTSIPLRQCAAMAVPFGAPGGMLAGRVSGGSGGSHESTTPQSSNCLRLLLGETCSNHTAYSLNVNCINTYHSDVFEASHLSDYSPSQICLSGSFHCAMPEFTMVLACWELKPSFPPPTEMTGFSPHQILSYA